MAVAPAWMADKIIVLDEGDADDSPQPSCSTSRSETRPVSQLKAQQPVIVHIPESPFATAKKESHVLQAENQRLFSEFVDHCSALTQDCPEVLTFLQTKYAKASPDFLKSVEFRNSLGRCLTRAQSNRSKTFVFINELCTILRKHCAKKRPSLLRVEAESSTSTSSPPLSNSAPLKCKDKAKGSVKEAQQNGRAATEDERPSTSEPQVEEAERKAARASRKQIAYLENLLKVYHEEISRLQQTELSLDDMEAEDSLYIQEHKLKRKMMKIYEKLCELKECSTLTGRVIEQRIPYSSTRFPEINKKIERFINSPEVRRTPPDYQDILQLVLRTNERQALGLSRKQLNQIALDAFRETGSRLQERRHLDLVFNFGSQLTDPYKPASDPALLDASLQRKLRANREVALSRLEEVITKYSNKQDDTEEQERSRRQDREDNKSEKGEEKKGVNGLQGGEEEQSEEKEEEQEEEEEEDEDEDSSDPDIEEEIRASTQQDGPDDDEDEKDNSNEEAGDEDAAGGRTGELMKEEEEEEKEVTSGLCPLSNDSKSQVSPSDVTSAKNSLSQSEPGPLSMNGHLEQEEEKEEPVGSLCPVPSSEDEPEVITTVAANGTSSPKTFRDSGTEMTNGVSTDGPRVTKRGKRKREEGESRSSPRTKHIIITDSEVDIPLDTTPAPAPPPQSSPPQAQTPTHDQVISCESTPPPKKNKVNVATQCDPDEVIVLSDSD